MEAYKERRDYEKNFIAEYNQLVKRLTDIKYNISHCKAGTNKINLYLYEKQLEAMIAYRNVLELRADVDNIKLNKEFRIEGK